MLIEGVWIELIAGVWIELIEGVWIELETKMCFLRTPWKKIIEKSTKLNKIDFLMECSTAEFYRDFLAEMSNLPFE